MRVYLAGPMTGIKDFNYPAFHAAAAQLRAKGYDVLSPAEHKDGSLRQYNEQVQWAGWVRRGLRLLLKSEAVFVLDGWEDSRGAALEVYIARQIEMPVYTLDQAWVSDRRAAKLAGQTA